MTSPNSTIILRNVLNGVGVEFNVALYAANQLRIRIADNLRKAAKYRRARLFYLRDTLASDSTVAM